MIYLLLILYPEIYGNQCWVKSISPAENIPIIDTISRELPGDLYFTNVESKVYPLWKIYLLLILYPENFLEIFTLPMLSQKYIPENVENYPTMRQKIWATVNIWYIVPSHQFLKGVLSFFQVLVYK